MKRMKTIHNLTKSNQKKLEAPVYIGVSIILLLTVVLSVIIAVTIGSTHISVKEVYSVIIYEISKAEHFADYASGAIHDVVWLIRLPRLILAAAVGGGLSVCGIVLQAVVKNPLADPYILGVSSGASFGATIAILLGVGASIGYNYVGVVAFVGAFITSVLVMTIANTGSRSNSVKLLLSGLAINALFSAFTSFFIYIADDAEGIKTVTFWLMGSLAGADWITNTVVSTVVIAGIVFFMTQYRILNMMLLGDEVSITLGTDLHRYRQLYMLVASLIIGFTVYSAGMIGFIGLVIPHLVRMLFGTNHKKLIPVAVLTGAVFMIWADVLSRVILPHTELPVGILVSVIGAPFFIYLLIKKSYGFGGEKN